MVEFSKRMWKPVMAVMIVSCISASFRVPPPLAGSEPAAATRLTIGDLPSAPAPYHPIFVSVTEMNHNQQDKTFEISCKIFTDDLETVLTKTTGAKIDLFNPKDTALTGKQISGYIGKHLVTKIDGKPVQLNFIGFERELDAVWSYFEVSQVNTVPKTVSVMNNLLYDNFKEQINLMHVTVAGKRKSTKLDNPEATADFSF